MATTRKNVRMLSKINRLGELDLRLVDEMISAPINNEVVVRIGAAPINPSDIGTVMLGPADMSTISVREENGLPVVSAMLPPSAMKLASVIERFDRALQVGNEGAGVVVDAGPAPEAQALLGKTVAFIGGSYSEFLKTIPSSVLVMPSGVSSRDASGHFVNPMTALMMVETMKAEGHSAIVHTAAASKLGQMLVKLCHKEGIGLVCVVRKKAQEELLRSIGAVHVVNSNTDGFQEALTEAVFDTNATIGFDAIGGGEAVHQILTAMELAQSRKPGVQTGRYGTNVKKAVYRYGALNRSEPTILGFNYGMKWSVGGFLLTHVLERLGPDRFDQLRAKVAAEIMTTFATEYDSEVSLREVLNPTQLNEFIQMASGKKYVMVPASEED